MQAVSTGNWTFVIKASEEEAPDNRYHDDVTTKQ